MFCKILSPLYNLTNKAKHKFFIIAISVNASAAWILSGLKTVEYAAQPIQLSLIQPVFL